MDEMKETIGLACHEDSGEEVKINGTMVGHDGQISGSVGADTAQLSQNGETLSEVMYTFYGGGIDSLIHTLYNGYNTYIQYGYEISSCTLVLLLGIGTSEPVAP